MSDAATLQLGGKVFRVDIPEALSLQQDGFIAAALERAGLTDPAMQSLEGPALVREAELRLMETGRLGQFLAGYLVPEGEPWARESAWQLAHTIDAITHSGEKDQLFAAVGGLVLGFFSSVRRSPPTGLSSSPAGPSADAPSPPAAALTTASGSR